MPRYHLLESVFLLSKRNERYHDPLGLRRTKNEGTGGEDRRETGTKRWPTIAARIR